MIPVSTLWEAIMSSTDLLAVVKHSTTTEAEKDQQKNSGY